jgi:phosphatidylserine decarboxylase
MKHKGKARKAAFRLIFLSLIAVVVIWALGLVIAAVVALVAGIGVAIIPFVALGWVAFGLFTLYFFRDPSPQVPAGANLVLSPAHGKIDAIDRTTEPFFMGGECQRISMFLSVFDVHVQNAPVGGKVSFFKYTTGQFLNALKAESATFNENVLMGFQPVEPRAAKIGVRLIAGVIARRIVPFVQQGDEVAPGDRISLIQFGSRSDVYLPLTAKIKVKLGDHVVGGETVLAVFD